MKQDLSPIMKLILEYPYIREYIITCYTTDNMDELFDYLIGVDE